MSAFEFFFSFFSLVMGLALVTVASGLANLLRARKVVPLGWLTPLLALLVLLDICSFWVIGWNSLQDVTITYATIYLGLAMTLVYFLSAAVVFPNDASEWPSLDDYYDSHKRLVLGGVLFSNALSLISAVVSVDPGEFDPVTVALLILFFGVLIALMIIRNRRVNLVLLLVHLSTDVAQAFVG